MKVKCVGGMIKEYVEESIEERDEDDVDRNGEGARLFSMVWYGQLLCSLRK